MAFTRILLEVVSGPAASEGPDGGFAGGVDAEGVHAFRGSRRSRQDDRAAVFHQRQGLLHCEKRAPDIAVECFVKMLFRYRAEWSKAAAPGIGDQDVNVSFLFFYLSIQTIEIGQIGDVALNAGDIAADFPDGLFQFMSGQEPRIGPNMFLPRIQAPTFLKPRAAKSSSIPVVPPSAPNRVRWNERVGTNHSCKSVPPTPSGFLMS